MAEGSVPLSESKWNKDSPIMLLPYVPKYNKKVLFDTAANDL